MYTSKSFVLLIAFFISSITSFSQKIRFGYDSAGNQILRTVCSNCSSKTSDSTIVKDYNEINQSSMHVFFDNDNISYYPNPTKDELFLKWENNNTVQTIDLFNMVGQKLKTYYLKNDENSFIVNFSELPSGEYILNLNYLNNEIKSIKIIKK
jgi:hypothetical protein